MKVIDLPELGPVLFCRHPKAKNFKITLKSNGSIRVTVPRLGTITAAQRFVLSKTDWILQKKSKLKPVVALSASEITRLRAEAKAYIPARVEVLAEQYGFDFNRVTIKNMTSRWGSCSNRKNLNFSLHLMSLDSVYIDYVILHELSHTEQMNHGPKFWALLDSVCPGAKKLDRAMRGFGMQTG